MAYTFNLEKGKKGDGPTPTVEKVIDDLLDMVKNDEQKDGKK